MLGGNAVRKHQTEGLHYFGIREPPEPAVLDLWNRRAEFTSRDAIIAAIREAYTTISGSLQLTYILGCSLYEIGYPEDHEEGRALLVRAADGGYGPALLKLGQRAFSAGQYEAAVTYWTGASEAKVGEGTCALARMYRDGMGVTRDMGHAEELYRKSITEGYYEAYNNLGAVIFHKSLPPYSESVGLWEQGLVIDDTVCFMNIANVLYHFSTIDKKTHKRLEGLVLIAHARHEPRADNLMQQLRLKPLRIRGPQVTDDDDISVEACVACLVGGDGHVTLNQCSRCRKVCVVLCLELSLPTSSHHVDS